MNAFGIQPYRHMHQNFIPFCGSFDVPHHSVSYCLLRIPQMRLWTLSPQESLWVTNLDHLLYSDSLFLFYVGLFLCWSWHFIGEAAVSAPSDPPTTPISRPNTEHLPTTGWTVHRWGVFETMVGGRGRQALSRCSPHADFLPSAQLSVIGAKWMCVLLSLQSAWGALLSSCPVGQPEKKDRSMLLWLSALAGSLAV